MPNSNKRNETTVGDGKVASAAPPSEVERLQEQVHREHDMYLRALADFDNFRRRIERDRQEAARNGKRGIVLGMIDVLDDFDRAWQQMGDARLSVLEGLQAIRRKMLAVLETQGVSRSTASARCSIRSCTKRLPPFKRTRVRPAS